MNTTVGLWMAVGVLGILAAYGNVSYYNQQTKYALMEKRIVELKAPDIAEAGNEDVKKLLIDKSKLDEKIEELENKGLVGLQEEKRELERNLERERGMLTDRDAEISKLKNQLAETTKIAAEQESLARKNAAAVLRADEADAELQRREEQLTKLGVDLENVTRAKTELETGNAALLSSAKSRIMELQREKAGLQQTAMQKTDATKRRERIGNGGQLTSGQILSLDLNSKLCVVDVGSVNNVRRGMRFDVIRRKADKWETLATVELTKINPSTSEAVIIDLPMTYKECPITGYVARDVEERYSPYVTGKDNSAIPLRAVTRSDVSSMSDANPVLVGDYIRNPLFDRNKKLKFTFAGEPVIFSEDVLKNRIAASGNLLQDEIDIETDYLILGKDVAVDANPDDPENEAFKAAERTRKARDFAEQYGIPIMREVELNMFLRN